MQLPSSGAQQATKQEMSVAILLSEADNTIFELSKEEKEALTILLKNQDVTTIGELQRKINDNRLFFDKKAEKMSWRKIEMIVYNLNRKSIIRSDVFNVPAENGQESDKRAKSRIILNTQFVANWQARRLQLIDYCLTKAPKISPRVILGEHMCKYYQISSDMMEKEKPFGRRQ